MVLLFHNYYPSVVFFFFFFSHLRTGCNVHDLCNRIKIMLLSSLNFSTSTYNYQILNLSQLFIFDLLLSKHVVMPIIHFHQKRRISSITFSSKYLNFWSVHFFFLIACRCLVIVTSQIFYLKKLIPFFRPSCSCFLASFFCYFMNYRWKLKENFFIVIVFLSSKFCVRAPLNFSFLITIFYWLFGNWT